MTVSNILLIVLAVLVVVAIGLIITLSIQRMNSRNLKRKFGPEYDYMMEKTGDRQSTEADLQGREKQVNELKIHSLSDPERERYHLEWNEIQASFVDDPLGAAQRANRAITEVMISRGFPVADFEKRSEYLSVLFPTYVPGYREANNILTKNPGDGISTEDLRLAMMKFHRLFDELISYAHDQEKVMEFNS